MCEQTPVDYNSGDIVWVKLGSCWWPGEVQDLDKLPEEWLSDFKKRPLAAVKFFDEDKYEYVRSIDKIYSYNCSKKNEFIKKGMDLHRTKGSFMEKFPADIATAETKTDGDPNILSRSIFTPEKKTNFAALLFDSTPKAKKPAKKTRKSKGRLSGGFPSFGVEGRKTKTITHPRFIGHDDHEVRILVQTRDREESASQDDPMYDCRSCNFKTSRIDVIVLHNKSHIQGHYNVPTSTPPRKNKKATGVKKLKMTRSKTSSIMEDLAMIDQGLLVSTESSDDGSLEEWKDAAPKKKRRKTKPKIKKPQVKKENVTKIDIRNNLLAEWEDDSDADDVTLNTSSNTAAGSDVSLNQVDTSSQSPEAHKNKSDASQLDKSCFDFEEENEDESIVVTGRKIPRVIPHSNKQKLVDPESDTLLSSETKSEDENFNKEEKDIKFDDPDIEAFRDILDVTSVPDLPEVPHSLKCEQNFHSARTIKFPDKVNISSSNSNSNDKHDSVSYSNEVKDDKAAKGKNTNSRVRTISNDEVSGANYKFNVENIPQDILETVPSKSTSKLTNVAESLSKGSTIETVVRPHVEELTEALCKQDIELEIAPLSDDHKISVNQKTAVISNEQSTTKLLTEKTIQVPIKESIESPKIINPKKRFVKSFEDFEQQLNNDFKRQLENELLDSPTETSNLEQNKNHVEVSKLKTQIKNKLDSCEKVPTPDLIEKKEVKSDSPSKTVVKSNRLTYESISQEVLRVDSELKDDCIINAVEMDTSVSDSVPQESHTDVDEPMDIDAFEKSEPFESELLQTSNVEDDMEFKSNDSLDKMVTSLIDLEQEKRDEEKRDEERRDEERRDEERRDEERRDEERRDEERRDEEKRDEENALIEEKMEQLCGEPSSDFCTQSNAYEESQTTDDLSALSTLAAVSELTTNLEMQNTIDVLSPIMNESSTLNISEYQKTLNEGDLSKNVVLHSKKSHEKPEVVTSTTPVVEDQIVHKSENFQFNETLTAHSHKNEHDTLAALLESAPQPPNKYVKSTVDNLVKVVKADMKPALSNVEFGGSVKPDKLQMHSKKIDIKSLTVLNKSGVKTTPTLDPKYPKFVTVSKSSLSPITKANKPIILSEKVIKPISETESVSVQKISSNRISQTDYEDMDAFIIQKSKCVPVVEDSDVSKNSSSSFIKKTKGKAKILQQTIIKPTGDIVKPHSETVASNCVDDNIFDINSMPIVLGDQILTTDCIENMPVVLSDTLSPSSNKTYAPASSSKAQIKPPIKLLNKANSFSPQPVLMKTYSSQKLLKSPKIYQTIPKNTKVAPSIIAKPKGEKFIIVSSINSSTPTTSKYTVGKKPIIKKTSVVSTSLSSPKIQHNPEPTGNKIMIVTNQQGQQSRVLLTPTQQKLLGYQTAKTKLVRNTLKNNILLKSTNSKPTLSPGLLTTTKPLTDGASSSSLVSSEHIVTSLKPQHTRISKIDPTKFDKKLSSTTQKILFQEGAKVQQKTIIVKNQGQIVKKLQGTDDALLEQQVAEKVQAIKASGSFSSLKSKQEVEANKARAALKRSYPKKLIHPQILSKALTQVTNSTATINQKSETVIPPLAPISPKKSEIVKTVSRIEEAKSDSLKAATKQEVQKPLNQLIIQDAAGNQTTITEGQILALPSGDTVDGQPQSYMLVTLDESGNLSPLNNEALLSLDPNLCLGGDLSNVVLQIDNDSTTPHKQDVVDNVANNKSLPSMSLSVPNDVVKETITSPIIETNQPTLLETASSSITDQPPDILMKSESFEATPQDFNSVQTVCNIASDSNRQLIITGDPESTQKFIESLTEGNQDLANLLATAEGNIIIQTDEQQILINTESTKPEESNPIYSKSQDILAAALADTDVFQLDHKTRSKITPSSQLSPSAGLYPTSVANLLDTTLSLSSPIMTPLEVPSSNTKKILDQEADVLEVPKNVDLPITITDPNISQTVSQQQVASLLMSELTSNLELPSLTVVEQPESVEISSSAYVYSLPTLVDEPASTCSKTFGGSISMPLLNEDSPAINIVDSLETKECHSDETDVVPTSLEDEKSLSHTIDSVPDVSHPTEDKKLYTSTFLDTTSSEEGLCTLGGAMCSSLSEPPPDMFDLSLVLNACSKECEIETTNVQLSPHKDSYETNITECDKQDTNDEINKDGTMLTSCESELTPTSINLDENSCEIPVQPQIITDLCSSFDTTDTNLVSNKRRLSSDDSIENEKKKSKLD